MTEDKLSRLKKEATLLEQLLMQEATSKEDAKVALDQLSAIFNKIKCMNNYQAIGRIRLDYLFIEGELANNNELSDCYSRFANLAEGLEV
jgi:hypothetical protein